MIFSSKFIIVFLLSAIPAVIWAYLFLRKHNENRWLVFATFIGGMIAAKLVLVYQGYWDETINLIFFKVNPVDFRENIKSLFSASPMLAIFLSSIGIGVIEEFLKFWIMRIIGHRFFKSINDVIELAILSALGFAFFENIVYFMGQWGKMSADMFVVFTIFRVTIVTMVHVLCSGVLGYYFGMAYFASPVLKIQHMRHKRHPVLQFFNRVLHFKKDHMYHDEMILIGLVSAMLLHALYDFMLTINISFFGFPLYIPIMLMYFFGGFWYLSRLLKKKDLNINMGLIGTNAMSRKEFIRLAKSIQEEEESKN